MAKVKEIDGECLERLITEQGRRFEIELQNIKASIHTARESAAELQGAKERALYAAISAVRDAVAVNMANLGMSAAKAEEATDKRFAGVEQRYGALNGALNEKLQDMSSRMDRSEGKGSGLNAGWGYLIAGLGLILTMVSVGIGVVVFISKK